MTTHYQTRFGSLQDYDKGRVEPIDNLPVEKLEQRATEANLVFRREKDGCLIVYGTDEAVKGFIKKISKPN